MPIFQEFTVKNEKTEKKSLYKFVNIHCDSCDKDKKRNEVPLCNGSNGVSFHFAHNDEIQ